MPMQAESARRTIYVCTSTKNLSSYRELQEALDPRYVLHDWTRLLPAPGPDFERRKDEDPRGRAFAFCSQACAGADLVIYLGPSGCDASCELGIAFAAGAPVWGVAGPEERPGVMVKGCVGRWFEDMAALIDELTRWRGWEP